VCDGDVTDLVAQKAELWERWLNAGLGLPALCPFFVQLNISLCLARSDLRRAERHLPAAAIPF
jgi:hypothetical protein